MKHDLIEIWRPVVGYEDLYSVSNTGKIMGNPRLVTKKTGGSYTTDFHLMRPGSGKKSRYLSIRLSKDGECKTHYVHHLVLTAFIGPKVEKHEACHNDGDRQNNCANNLRWGTKKENHADKNIHGTSPTGERHPMAKLSNISVLALRARRNAGASFTDLANEFGVTRMTAHRAATGTSWSHLA